MGFPAKSNWSSQEFHKNGSPGDRKETQKPPRTQQICEEITIYVSDKNKDIESQAKIKTKHYI